MEAPSTPTPAPIADDAAIGDVFDVSVEAANEAKAGQTVETELAISNKTDGPVSYFYGGAWVSAMRADGSVTGVMLARHMEDILMPATLAPGEKDVYREEWDQTSTEGEPLPAGEYFVVATVEVWASDERKLPAFETEPLRLVIE
ncbi:MAG: hypothetical protein ACOC5M_00345 [Chloroflexota bacterium]